MDGLTTARPSPPPAVARQRNVILAVLLGLAAAGWLIFITQSRESMGMGESMGRPDLTMGRSWPLFLSMWVAMMTGMMFPASVPMVLMFGRMKRSDPLSVALFVASYIGLWFAFGALAYLLGAGTEVVASSAGWIAGNWARAGGALIVLAGLYQLTPLKDVCLRRCRTPMAFVMAHWRDGRTGALRMGLRHGFYCVGCCWLLFLILVPIGVMNAAAMLGVAVVVFVEKLMPWGRGFARLAAVGMIAFGVAIALRPSLLPTVA